jgi:release factor glutamine methyltransferase
MSDKNIIHIIHELSQRIPPHEAWWLLEKITNQTKAELLALGTINLSPHQEQTLHQWITERVIYQKPLQYIVGSVPFCGLDVIVRPPILIPRPETEEWATWLINSLKLQEIKTPFTILDLCCGSGCIGLALAHAFPEVHVVGIDISQQALDLALENKKHNNISNITFVQSDMFENLPPDFYCDIIVSNPPYLAPEELIYTHPEVHRWEDHQALVSRHHGMYFYECIFENSLRYVQSKNYVFPQIIVEIGLAQQEIDSLLKLYGFKNFEILYDQQGRPRWVAVHLPLTDCAK